MRGVILAGGLGTRLRPLTGVYNKNLLPLSNRFIIDFPLDAVISAGVKDLMIITGPEHIGSLVGLLGSGKNYNLNITYKIQDTPNGIAAAIGLAEDFAAGDNILVILGDNVFDADLSNSISHNSNASVAYYEVPDPERFGVLVFDKNGKPESVVEKPAVAPSNKAVVGVYSYPSDVFDKIRTLKPSARGEYEVTDLNNLYFTEKRMECFELKGFWCDAGTVETYCKAFEWASKR
jgi:glucose-1-phosphate thymidylyltransferase